MITAGLDIGTKAVKSCIVEGTGVLGYAEVTIEKGTKNSIKKAYEASLKMAGLKNRSVKKRCVTGYCSEMLRKKNTTVSEIECMARAVYFLNKSIRTVVNIGNLFISIVTIGEDGRPSDTIINDKCAAGSGRFIEIISEALEIPVDSISQHALRSNNPFKISNNCAVFAESEVISQVNNDLDRNDIIASVLNSIISRTLSMMEKISAGDNVAIIGGVAKIDALKVLFVKMTGRKVIPLEMDPQIITAYGAALMAQGQEVRQRSASSIIQAN